MTLVAFPEWTVGVLQLWMLLMAVASPWLTVAEAAQSSG